MNTNHHSECRCGPCNQCRAGEPYVGLYGSCECGSCAYGHIMAAQAAANAGPLAGKVRDSSLTFAEAMALDPGEVEVHIANDVWGVLDKHKHFTLETLRVRKFRRSRPKRSRVQEMAESEWGAGSPAAKHSEKERTAVIRAVCEYLEKEQPSSACNGCSEALAKTILRHFTEPR